MSIRVLIVDDSLFMRSAIKKLLETDGRFEIVGQARDGEEGVRLAMELGPDVITMDFNMPKLDGAQATREIMTKRPTPIVLLSAHARQGGKETLQALTAGAVDFVTKPSGEVSAYFSRVAPEMEETIAAAAEARPVVLEPATRERPSLAGIKSSSTGLRITLSASGQRVVVVGVSTGGPAALTRVVPALPGRPPFAMVIVQHMPTGFTQALAERLAEVSDVGVREAIDGDVLQNGTCLLAPGDRHVVFSESGRIRLTTDPPVHGCRPSADVTLRSAAQVFGRRVTGVLMTGMGKDGAEGLAAIRAAGGRTLAQDRATSVIFGMPRAAIEMGVVDEVLALDDIAPALLRQVPRTAPGG
ncbi:MAG: chemotaxis response regulator protein-glutamate methylesterase [Deltaproteobacteria bacterium]|nr:chemotaxis response regulator protein-glutamate methylesterase [Deltaproteobacteria bacterium]